MNPGSSLEQANHSTEPGSEQHQTEQEEEEHTEWEEELIKQLRHSERSNTTISEIASNFSHQINRQDRYTHQLHLENVRLRQRSWAQELERRALAARNIQLETALANAVACLQDVTTINIELKQHLDTAHNVSGRKHSRDSE